MKNMKNQSEQLLNRLETIRKKIIDNAGVNPEEALKLNEIKIKNCNKQSYIDEMSEIVTQRSLLFHNTVGYLYLKSIYKDMLQLIKIAYVIYPDNHYFQENIELLQSTVDNINSYKKNDLYEVAAAYLDEIGEQLESENNVEKITQLSISTS